MIYVCNLREMPLHVRDLRPSHLVSLLAPHEQPPTPEGLLAKRHLRVGIDDISEPLDDYICPEETHVGELIDFLRGWEPRAPLVIHCYAGISRSMAAALIALALPVPGREIEAARHMRAEAPHASPNRRLIALADAVLGCEGRLIAARDAMGPARATTAGPLVRLTPLV